MVVLDEGIEKIAEIIEPELTQGQWGTGTTSPTETDTGLETPVAATKLTTTSTLSGTTIEQTHTLPSTAANGNTLTEFSSLFSDDTNLDRTVGGGISKTASIEVITISQFNIIRG